MKNRDYKSFSREIKKPRKGGAIQILSGVLLGLLTVAYVFIYVTEQLKAKNEVNYNPQYSATDKDKVQINQNLLNKLVNDVDSVSTRESFSFYDTLSNGTSLNPLRTQQPVEDTPPSIDKIKTKGGKFYVQVGAFHQEEQAEKLKDELSSKGFQSSITEGSINFRVVYRVRILDLENFNDAKKVEDRLKTLNYPTSIGLSL